MRGTEISVVRHTTEFSVRLTTEISVKSSEKADETSFNEHKLGHSNKQKELRGETLHLTNFKWHNFLDSQVWLLKTIIMY